jgi:tetratricopeptide (TPR) repeat protein
LARSGEYFAAWAKFYRALATDEREPDRTRLLKGVLQFIVDDSGYTERPHAETGIQCESLVLAGMTARLLEDYVASAKYLRRARETAGAITDPEGRAAVQWVVVLAGLEAIKVDRDQGNYEAADEGIQRFRAEVSDVPGSGLGTQLAVTLLETNVYEHRAEAAREAGDAAGYRRWRAQSRQALLALARSRPDYRDAVYATVYRSLGPVADPAGLDPFEKNVYLAGLMREATEIRREIERLNAQAAGGAEASLRTRIAQLTQDMAKRFDNAIAVADTLLTDKTPLAAELRPDTLFNRAVCLYERGDLLEAANTFVTVARDHPRFERAEISAGHAVDIAAQLFQDDATGQQPSVREAFLAALRTLTTRYPESARARYAQFFLGNVLDRLGRYDEAAEEYAKVGSDHEKSLDARYYRLICLQRLFERQAADEPEHVEALARTARTLIAEAKAVTRAALAEVEALRKQVDTPSADSDPAAAKARLDEVIYFAGDAELMAATIRCAAPLRDYALALEQMRGFTDRYPGRQALIGSALRVRILAHQGLGQFQAAADIVDEFLNQSPDGAGGVIASLLASMRDEVIRRREGEQVGASTELVALADRLWRWVERQGAGVPVDERLAVRSMLADAHLLAGQAAKALVLFDACIEEDAKRMPDGRATHGPSLLGRAEALRKLERYDEAVKGYNEVWRRTEERSRLWWQALAGSLACHTQLETDPETILTSIAQHRHGDPQMGGPRLKAEFDRIESVNRRRRAGGGAAKTEPRP